MRVCGCSAGLTATDAGGRESGRGNFSRAHRWETGQAGEERAALSARPRPLQIRRALEERQRREREREREEGRIGETSAASIIMSGCCFSE